MFVPPTNIDLLYDYIPLLNKGPLCTIPQEAIGKEVAIIGAGAAGMVAAHELMKIGLKPVIFEASGRMGGRLYSKHFRSIQDDDQPFAEMGAMRIPLSSKIFFHYAKQLGLTFDREFPGAGSVNTAIYYRNKRYLWKKNDPMPEPFATVKILWELFIQPMVDRIHAQWQAGNIETVQRLWQMNIDQYKYMSFYQVLKERSPLFSPEQISILGALGIGHGGFSPVFQVSFLEILRILVNQYMSEHVMISEGVSEFISRLYALEVETPFGKTSLAKLECVNLNLPVVLLDYNPSTNNPVVVVKNIHGEFQRKDFHAVIFTGSICAANLINITNPTQSGRFLLNSNVREAIKNSPMLPFSKTYICTKNKFWLGKDIPSYILTDDISRMTCFLDYPLTHYGVICLSYSWGMAATKLHAVDPKDRVTIFKRALAVVYPGLEDYLQPLNDEVLNIDWINVKYQNGAFRIFTPGYDTIQAALYYQFQSSSLEEDRGLYLAGDNISWSPGWVEGALYTSLNSVYAVAKRFGAQVADTSPLGQNPNLYHY